MVYSGTFYPGYEAPVLRTLSLATLALCALHSTHTHTWSSTVDSLLLCQGISHDQSQSFVSPGVKKVKTERRRRLEGNIVRFRAYTLFRSSWQSRDVSLQNCSRRKKKQKHCDPATCSNCFHITKPVHVDRFCLGIQSYDKLNTETVLLYLNTGIKRGKKRQEAKHC